MNPSQKINLTTLRIGAILNTASGSCDAQAEEDVTKMLHDAGAHDPHIWCGAPDEMEKAFAEAKSHELDLLIVLGGDGTIRSAAEACTETGPLLMPLPGGTMNMLPKAVYGEGTWREVLAATLANPSTRSISSGKIEEHQFYVATILGAPSLWAEAREAVRGGNVVDAVSKGVTALQNAFSTELSYEYANQQGSAEAITVLCPVISEALDDREPALEAAVIDVKNAFDALALASTAAFGKWRDDAHVTTTKVTALTVSSEKNIPAILDGETFEFENTVKVEFVPVAFRALVPKI